MLTLRAVTRLAHRDITALSSRPALLTFPDRAFILISATRFAAATCIPRIVGSSEGGGLQGSLETLLFIPLSSSFQPLVEIGDVALVPLA